MQKYFSQHKNRIIDLIPVPSVRNLVSGTIVYARYKAEGNGKSTERIFLVINVVIGQGKIHLLDLGDISVQHLHDILKFTKEKEPVWKSFNKKKYTIVEFTARDRAIYNSIKNLSMIDGKYKTFFADSAHISNIKVINYRWDASSMPFDSDQEQNIKQEIIQEKINKTKERVMPKDLQRLANLNKSKQNEDKLRDTNT